MPCRAAVGRCAAPPSSNRLVGPPPSLIKSPTIRTKSRPPSKPSAPTTTSTNSACPSPSRQKTTCLRPPLDAQSRGEVERERVIDIDTIGDGLGSNNAFIMRCVEAWSMVIRGSAFPGSLIKRLNPTSRTKCIFGYLGAGYARTTAVLQWPYKKGYAWMRPCTR